MGQRDRLLGRRIPPTPVAIRVVFTPEADAAQDRFDAAARALAAAEARADPDLAELRQAVEDTRAGLAPFVEVLEVAAIPPDRYDDLITAHPPTDSQRQEGAGWNPETFLPALMAACIGQDLPDEERMSEKDWAEWAATSGSASSGELRTLLDTCLRVNDRSPDVMTGKAWSPSPS